MIRRTLASALLVVAAAPAGAQPGQPNMGLGPQLPKSGTIARDTAYERKVLEQMKPPPGFAMTLFAGPPIAMYPTFVGPAPDGSVYVGVDLNLAQGAVKGRGRVMRLVDSDGDGRADRYTTFLETDSPRGVAFDGNTVFVLHPPNLTAYRDTNGDGIADWSDVIVKDIGFSLDVRSSDHATNNIAMGPDGWLYIAVGDYGHLRATGKDGTTITRHGGALARVRPDGTGLEDYTFNTRNIYDAGIDPFGRAFTRDNTNDGGGWDTRFHYLAPMADVGYPRLFRYFADEILLPIADYGAGSGTSGLWIQDPGFPDEWNNTLFTGDWTVNKIFHHTLRPKGASFAIEQKDFMVVPRAIDHAMDDRSQLYVASLIGGVFNYAGDTVGAIVRVTYPGRRPSAALNPERASDEQLLDALISPNYVHRQFAQREILRRGTKSETVRRLERAIMDAQRPADARAAALFTLKLLTGERSHAALQRAAADPVMREVALRALADDPRQARNVPVQLFVDALRDPDYHVRVQALHGLVRLGARDRAAAILPLLSSDDAALAHVATRALARLGARDVALRALSDPATPAAVRTRARHVLQLIQEPATVTAVLDAYNRAQDPGVKREALLTLARLTMTDAEWKGDWWGTRPNTLGPYFTPVAWSETPRLKPVLLQALGAAEGADFTALVEAYVRNRVVPAGAKPLILAVSNDAAMRVPLVEALLGTSQVSAAAAPLLRQLEARGGPMRVAVAELLAEEPTFDEQTLPLARTAALDASLDPALRGRLLGAIAAIPGDPGRDASIEIYSRVNPRAGAPNIPAAGTAPTGTPGAPPAGGAPGAPGAGADPVEAAWRRFVGDRNRAQQLDHFIALTRSGDQAQRTLAYAVLVQSVRNPRAPQPVRDKVNPVIEAAWNDPAAAQSLVDAITIMRVESQYADRLRAFNAVRK